MMVAAVSIAWTASLLVHDGVVLARRPCSRQKPVVF
jgi:hypothetical protein